MQVFRSARGFWTIFGRLHHKVPKHEQALHSACDRQARWRFTSFLVGPDRPCACLDIRVCRAIEALARATSR